MVDVVLILGSGPNVIAAADWPRAACDRIVAINNAWAVRDDWDDLIYPEDFPSDRRPARVRTGQRLIEAQAFVPAQNAFGGFVYGGGTMAFTAGYWALHALRPRVMAFMGCDMVYPSVGPTHYYGTGAADPLREDVTLRDLGAKAARLGLLAAREGCACVNLSNDPSQLVFPQVGVHELRQICAPEVRENADLREVLRVEQETGYFVPSGRYWEDTQYFDEKQLARIDDQWRTAYARLGASVIRHRNAA
jgi:hypothetical protein